MSTPAFVGIDWGTTRFRAYLIDETGAVIDRVTSDDGIMAVKPGGFPAVLAIRCGMWLARDPDLPVLMAGMVGSRNGWVEAPYRACPASASDLARAMIPIDIGNGRIAHLVPGLSTRDAQGAPDVLRGEETLALGAGLQNGLVILPGTHSKWISVEASVMSGFSTFMTGEFYATLLGHTILGALRKEPDAQSGFEKGLRAAKRSGGLTHQAFAARTAVLLGDMTGEEVAPFLSGLLIGVEIENACALYPNTSSMVLIAEGVIAENYKIALAAKGITYDVMTPEAAFIKGLFQLTPKG